MICLSLVTFGPTGGMRGLQFMYAPKPIKRGGALRVFPKHFRQTTQVLLEEFIIKESLN